MDGRLADSSRIGSAKPRLAELGLVCAVFCANTFGGVLELTVLDGQTGKPLPARIRLTGPRGRHPKAGVSRYSDYFLTYGFRERLNLSAGTYHYEITCGPEYRELIGSFEMAKDATDNKTVEIARFVDMKSHGWWSGDSWFDQKLDPMGIQALAEDLHVLGIADESKSDKGESTNLDDSPIFTFATADPEIAVFPKNAKDKPNLQTFVMRGEQLHRQLTNISDWDLPSYIASGQVDSIVIHRPHLKRPKGTESRPRNIDRFPDQDGEGRYHEFVYQQLLNAGLRVTPVAATGSGFNKLAPGTYRTYVFIGTEHPLDELAWWKGLKQGKVIITNGPLMLPKVNGRLPGYEFVASEGESVKLDTSLNLYTRTKIDYLQFLKNGESVAEIRLDEWARQGKSKLPTVTFSESGWMQIRAVTRSDQEYQYAATGPYFVKIGDRPRISRKAVEFFLDWTYKRARNIKKAAREEGRNAIAELKVLRKSRDYWKAIEQRTNAD